MYNFAQERLNHADVCYELRKSLEAAGCLQLKSEPSLGVGRCRADIRGMLPNQSILMVEVKVSGKEAAGYMEGCWGLNAMLSAYGPSCVPMIVLYNPVRIDESYYRSLYGFKNVCCVTDDNLCRAGNKIIDFASSQAKSIVELSQLALNAVRKYPRYEWELSVEAALIRNLSAAGIDQGDSR